MGHLIKEQPVQGSSSTTDSLDQLDLTRSSSLSFILKQGNPNSNPSFSVFFFFKFIYICVFWGRWMEHDPLEILESVQVCIVKAIDKATTDGHNVDNGLKAIRLTNQRETTLVWSKSTGLPLHKAIVWMDVRTSSICRYFFFPSSIPSF